MIGTNMGESNLKDWQIHYSQTKERLAHLLLTKLWADCTFRVGSVEREEIKAHKFVLSMCSPVFETMFYGSIPEGDGPIEITDAQPEAFKTFLKFLYTDDTNIKSYQEASEVYCLAKKYMVPFVQERCSRHMQWTLTPKEACFAYEFGKLFDEERIEHAAIKIMQRRTREVIKEGSFFDVSIKTVQEIFALPDMNIHDERDLFHALEKYAENLGLKSLKRKSNNNVDDDVSDQKRIKLDANNSIQDTQHQTIQEQEDEEVVSEEEILSEVRKALPQIRLLTLPAHALGSIAYSSLLTEDEAFALMLNIAGAEYPLPAGLSDSREKRGLRQVQSPTYMPTPPLAGSSWQSQAQVQQPALEPPPPSFYEAMCVYSVANFKTRKRPVQSDVFYTNDFGWQIRVTPGVSRGADNVEQKVLGVFVHCDGPSSVGKVGNVAWSCQAEVSIEMRRPADGGVLRRDFTYRYDNNSKSSGYTSLVPWSAVCDYHGGYLRSNCLRLVARVKAITPTSSP